MSVWIMCNKLFHYVQQKERIGSFYGQKISLAFFAVVFSSSEVTKKWQQCQTFVKIGLKTIASGICFASEMKWQGFHNENLSFHIMQSGIRGDYHLLKHE